MMRTGRIGRRWREDVFDEDKSALANSRMWLKIARSCEKYAHEMVGCGELNAAIKAARFAEAAYWQATGQGDFAGMERLFKEATQP